MRLNLIKNNQDMRVMISNNRVVSLNEVSRVSHLGTS